MEHKKGQWMGQDFRNIIVSLIASCGLKAIWMALWEKGSLLGRLEQNQVYQITCAMQFKFGTPERNKEDRDQ